MGVTIKDIANRLNLSDPTVSRILNNKLDFHASEKTRELVFKTAVEMGYQRNHAARALVTGRTNLVSFWSPGIALPFFSSVAGHFQNVIRSQGYEIIMCEYGRAAVIPQFEAGLSGLQTDGIFFLGGGSALDHLLEGAGRGVPVVQCSSGFPDHECTADLVYINIYTPACEAMSHLISSGCKSIVFFGNCRKGEPRYRAYSEAMEKACLETSEIPVGNGTHLRGREDIKGHIKAHGRPDAIFCSNDELAICVYRGLLDLGIKVPNEVALVGCDGIWETEYLEVPITTIVQPVDEMVETAWGFLLSRMQDKSIPVQKAEIKAKLVIRESSRR